MTIEKRISTLEFKYKGDPNDNSDDGFEGQLRNLNNRLISVEGTTKKISQFALNTLSGFVLAALIGACTYLYNTIRNGGSIDNHNNHSYDLGSSKDSLRGRKSVDFTHYKTRKNGN